MSIFNNILYGFLVAFGAFFGWVLAGAVAVLLYRLVA